MDKHTQTAERLNEIADTIENNPHAREATAEGFRLIAALLQPCTDCGQDTSAAGVIAVEDNPATGTEASTATGTEASTATGTEASTATGTEASTATGTNTQVSA